MKKIFFLIFILFIALCIRLDFLIANSWTIDSDEAIVGLMAKNILLHGDNPIFYYGQNYLGSLEAYCVALSFKFFGISNFSLKLVPLIFSIIFVYLVYLLTKEVSNRRSAIFATILAAIAPCGLIVWSGKARGGFIEVLVFGALILLLSFKWQKSETKSLWWTIFIAFLLGVAWWVNNQILYFIPCVGIVYLTGIYCDKKKYLETKNKECLTHFVVGLVSFFIGSILFWYYNFTHDFSTFGMFSPEWEDFSDHFDDFFKYSFPILIGTRRFWDKIDIYRHLTNVAYAIYLSLFILFLILSFKNKEKKDYPGIPFIYSFLVVIISIIVIFSASQFGSLYLAPRYLLPFYVVFFPLLGIFINKIYEKQKIIGLGFLFLILLLNIVSDYAKKRALLGEPLIFQEQRASDNHDKLISYLRENNINLIRTNYWIGYRLAFETNEDIKFIVTGIPKTIRIKSYEKLAKGIDKNTIPILAVPREAKYMRSALRFLGYEFTQIPFDNYKLIYNIKKTKEAENEILKEIPKANIKVSVSDHPEDKDNMIDGSKKTRWGSARPQDSNMFVRFDFARPYNIKEFKYSLGEFGTDHPRALEIYGVDSNNNQTLLMSAKQYEMLSHYVGNYINDINLKLDCKNCKSIIFNQVGKDTFFDWSIAEIYFYE